MTRNDSVGQFLEQTLLILCKIIYWQFPISSTPFATASWKLHRASDRGCWDPEGRLLTWGPPSWYTAMSATWLELSDGRTSRAVVVWGTVLYCPQSKQSPWAQYLCCEPREPILLRNGLLGPSHVTAGGWDILTPVAGGTILKRKPCVLKIDNAVGLDEGERVAFLSLEDHLWF